MTKQSQERERINSSQPTEQQGNPQDTQIPYMHGIPIEPLFDFEDDLWFAGVLTGLPFGPWSQRNEFYAFHALDGSNPDSAFPYSSKHDAEIACQVLRAMSQAQLLAFDPQFFSTSSPQESK